MHIANPVLFPRKPNLIERFRLLRYGIKYILLLNQYPSQTEYVYLTKLYMDCIRPGMLLDDYDRPGYILPNLDVLSQYPEGSLGYIYSSYIQKLLWDGNGNPMDYLQRVKEKERSSGLELRSRFKNTRVENRFLVMILHHDLYHVLTNLSTSVMDELYLQAFVYGQMGGAGNRLFLIAGIVRGFKLNNWSQIVQIWEWLQRGKQTKNLYLVNWDDYWALTLEQVQDQLKIQPHVDV